MSPESVFGSRPPQTDSAPAGRGPDAPDSESRSGKDLSELPSPTEKVREFLEVFGERAHEPLSEVHGRELRPECCIEETEMSEYVTDDGGTERVEEVVERRAAPLWEAVAEMLDWHEEYHGSTLRLEYGQESDPTHEILDIDLQNSWFAAYQDEERAKLKALERETCGFETCGECETRWCQEPDEHDTEFVDGTFEEPVVVLTSRTASGRDMAPVDHAREIAEAWSSDDGGRRSLRYILDEKLGLECEEWVRWTQGEPHTSKRAGDTYGTNEGYHHAHDIIILDGAAADEEVTAATFRTLIESHVSECDGAGREAHDLDAGREKWENGDVDTVSVKEVDGEIEESVASYSASYLANEKVDLLEREPSYLAWAATMWATETQKGIKSDSGNHAIATDRCRHKHHAGDQELAHGEEVTTKRCRCAEQPYGPGCRRCDGRGYHVVCLECGSPWEIEQSETLVSRRTGGSSAVADGGFSEPETVEEKVEEDLRERWPSARSAAVVGGPTVEREVVGREGGRELEGRTLRLGGGQSYCVACGEVEPTGECSATAYREAEYELFCPLPPEHFGEHTVQEGRNDAGATVSTGSDQYRGDGHVSFEYAEPPDGLRQVSVGFERPPRWRARAIIRDGEEIPATGGTTDKKGLKLRGAPDIVASMAVRSPGVVKCMECGVTYDSVREFASHGCDGEVGVGWLARDGGPAREKRLDRGEFLEAVPDRFLEDRESGGEPERGDRGGEVPEEVRRYVENHPEESAVAVAGRFGLPPESVQLLR